MKIPPVLSLSGALLAAGVASALHAASGDSQVARWRDNKTACFLLMFDDSCPSHFQVAIPEMVKRDMIGTFYINPGGSSYTSNSNQWTNVIPSLGMVYGDHTWDHGNTTTLAAMDDEIRKCLETIKSIYYPGDATPRLVSYGQPGVTTWYSYGQPLTDILNKYNLVSRPAFIAGEAPFTGINTVPALLAVADTAITKKGMGYTIFHGLQRRPSEGDPDMGGQDFWAFDKEVYRQFLDGLKIRRDGGNLWITDPISYHKYETERNGATIQVTAVTSASITLTLATTAGSLYDLPLTVVTQVPAAWKGVVVTQDARQVHVPVIGGAVLYDALPNAGPVTITESPLPVVTVKATAPEAYETGAVPGTFTLSSTGSAGLTVNYTITGTGARGTRYTLAAGPVTFAPGVSSATVAVVPVPNSVYEGEQSVVLTITAGGDYAVGPAGSAIVMIHDRTDLPPSDWYLHAGQTSAQHWNTVATWWSQPVGGTALTAYSRGTVADRFHTNGFELRTKNAYYPPDQSFYGNNIVLDGPAARLSLALTAYYGSAGMPTNTVPTLTALGGSIIPYSSALTQLLTVGTFNSLGTTKISNGGNASHATCGLHLKVTKLTGTGDLVLTNALGTAGTVGSLLLNIANASNYRGNLNLVAGTLSFPSNLTSSGPLTLAAGSAVTNGKAVKVARLTLGAAVMPAGTYTADQLNGRGVVFSGTGTFTTSLLPDGWSSLDVGSPALGGDATYAGTTWTVTGGGTQIGGTLDKFSLVSALTSTGAPSILARVGSFQNGGSASQAGVMLRDNTDGAAPCVALTVSPAGVVTFRARTVAGGAASAVQAPATVAPPVWLRLTTAAGVCTGAYSTDNRTWTRVGEATPVFAGTPLAGLAVCAGTDAAKTAATFTDVALENSAPVLTVHTVSASVWPAGAGSVAGAGLFRDGTPAAVIATPADGYGFAAWSEGGTSLNTSATYGFTVGGDRTFVAHFQPARVATFTAASFTPAELATTAVSGLSADPDGDGYPNLLEYALGLNPKEPNPPQSPGEVVDGRLALTYRRSKTAADLVYTVEVSGDLRTWKSGSSDVSTPVIKNDDGYTQTVLVRDLMAASPEIGPRFIRLRVSTP